MHCKAEESDMERKVNLSEMRSRDGLAYRAKVDSFKLFFDGLTFTERLPIGTTERINNLTREQFLRFYQKWYRPDLMVLVAVGDMESNSEATRRSSAGKLWRSKAGTWAIWSLIQGLSRERLCFLTVCSPSGVRPTDTPRPAGVRRPQRSACYAVRTWPGKWTSRHWR